MLEKQIERKVCDYATSRGMLHYKFSSPGHASVPDRMFITAQGQVFFIEFKREGCIPTPQQAREHTRMRNFCVDVHVVDDVEKGKEVIRAYC